MIYIYNLYFIFVDIHILLYVFVPSELSTNMDTLVMQIYEVSYYLKRILTFGLQKSYIAQQYKQKGTTVTRIYAVLTVQVLIFFD